MRNVLTIAAAALGVATATTAHAQTQDPDALIPVNVSVRLGVALPLDDNLREISSTLLAFGLEYKIDNSLFRSGETYFALDLFKGDTSDNGYIIPFTLNQRFYLRQLGEGRRTYGFVGAGVSFQKGTEHWGQAIAGRAGVGAELGDRIYLESALTITNKTKGSSGNNIGFYLGYRF